MRLSDIITSERILVDREGALPSKAEALRALARLLGSAVSAPEEEVLALLLEREQLQSTGIGDGVAIPHSAPGELAAPFALLARLARPIEFDAIDDQPVDLVFLLLSPADRASHLKALSVVSRQLRSAGVTERLRRARTAAEMYAAMTE